MIKIVKARKLFVCFKINFPTLLRSMISFGGLTCLKPGSYNPENLLYGTYFFCSSYYLRSIRVFYANDFFESLIKIVVRHDKKLFHIYQDLIRSLINMIQISLRID